LAHATESLTARTAQAAQWRVASAVAGAVSRLSIGVVLARLLTPAGFGVMALRSLSFAWRSSTARDLTETM
jgi:hypothetical protein